MSSIKGRSLPFNAKTYPPAVAVLESCRRSHLVGLTSEEAGETAVAVHHYRS